MKVSIVMAYYNRKDLTLKTFESINNSENAHNCEVIMVDDASREEHRLEDLIGKYKFDLKIIRLEKEDKWYVNPCIPFNKGIQASTGDIIFLQNPECLHTGDLITFAINNLNSTQYFSFGCYSLNEESTNRIKELNLNKDGWLKELMFNISPIVEGPVHVDGSLGWYNHSRFRPVGYHFCSAIFASQLKEMGGFDERYAPGYAFDDNEILARIMRKGLQVVVIDNPFVCHQWHYADKEKPYKEFEDQIVDLLTRNRELYFNTTLKENTWKVN